MQQGNSGGPLLDDGGLVIGVVVGKLNAIKMAVATGDIPQNVNFAIHGALARAFLETRQVPYATSSDEDELEPEEIAQRAKSFVLLIESWR